MTVTPFEYAKLSVASYNKADSTKVNFGYHLPEGWKFYKASSVTDYSKDGYSGTAFIKGNEIVIAHRGTNSYLADQKYEYFTKNSFDFLKDSYSNLQLWLHKEPEQFKSAKAFTQQILLETSGKTISFTGHSLGGLIAQLSSVNFEKHATVFDSPGAKEIILNKYGYIPKNVDILEYASQPNIINSANTHLTTPTMLPNILVSISGPNYQSFVKATFDSHKMEEIAKQFNQETGEPEDYIKIKHWPVGTKEAFRFFVSYDKNKKFWDSFMKNEWENNPQISSKFKSFSVYKKDFIKNEVRSTETLDIFNILEEIENGSWNSDESYTQKILENFVNADSLTGENYKPNINKKILIKSATKFILGKIFDLVSEKTHNIIEENYDNLKIIGDLEIEQDDF